MTVNYSADEKPMSFSVLIKLFTCLSLLLWCLAAKAGDSHGDLSLFGDSRVVDAKTGQTLDKQAWLNVLATQEHVILGEYHDSREQHRMAHELLQRLHQLRPQGALLLEMLQVNQQPLVDAAYQTPILDSDSLARKIGWKRSWHWDYYDDLVLQAIFSDYPLVATNLTDAEVAQIMRGAAPIFGYESTEPDVQQAIAKKIKISHGLPLGSLHKSDEQLVNKMVQVQQFRDRRMAEKILMAPAPNLLLAGNFHAQKDLGVSLHLQDLQGHLSQPKTAIVIMMINTKDLDGVDVKWADYFWVID